MIITTSYENKKKNDSALAWDLVALTRSTYIARNFRPAVGACLPPPPPPPVCGCAWSQTFFEPFVRPENAHIESRSISLGDRSIASSIARSLQTWWFTVAVRAIGCGLRNEYREQYVLVGSKLGRAPNTPARKANPNGV